jgi:aminopeptidase YwaD
MAVVLGAAPRLLAQQVNPADIQRHVGVLASPALQGRGSGEAGNDKAARYIAEHFRSVGLKPLGTSRQRDVRAKADGSGYFQPFTFPVGVEADRSSRFEVALMGTVWRGRLGTDWQVHPLSGSGDARGEVVFVGGKGQDADYAGVDVRGRVVLLAAGSGNLAVEIPGRAAVARSKGASAVLVVPATPGKAGLSVGGDLASADAGIPILLVSRDAVSGWMKGSGRSWESLESDGKSVSTGLNGNLALSVRKVVRTTANVAGWLEGSDPALRGEVVVVGAHMDHLGMGGSHSLADSKTPQIHPGADDNASGTAAVMALASELSRPAYRPRRSVLFLCFSGEELGLLGSAHYVRSPLVPIGDTVAMINMDMVGRMKDNQLSVIGSGTGSSWESILDGLGVAKDFTLKKDEGGFGGSDHQSFANAKVPVLFFFTGLHADYHKPSDTADKINVADTARIASTVGQVARAVADNPIRPEFRVVQAPPSPGRMRARASLGTVPEYAAGVVGVLLGGVRPGSPAEKAGLKAGDILIEFAGRPVRNVEEYTFALSEHGPGETVSIKVKRGDAVVEVKAVLAESRR